MVSLNLSSLASALENSEQIPTGVDFSGKSLKLDSAEDAQPIVDAINACPNLQYLTLTGNTLGVKAAEAISKALALHPELKICRFSDMFTGRMKTEIPPALSALGEGMIAAGARISVLDLSDNAFGPIGVEGLAKFLESDACSELEELRLNNNGLGITGGQLLADALTSRRRRLKIFIAGRNRLENKGATALANVFREMGTLEEIAMPQNGIYHEGITALSNSFKHNPQLARLNLNDNTVGPKGARSFAEALPKLKNLKAIDFGDCLLKNNGAIALAKAFVDNKLLVESIDLSHNEIGPIACMDVVDALTGLPDYQERLSRVSLTGNNLGGMDAKEVMRERLGASAELSGDDDSDNEYSDDTNECSSELDSDASILAEDSPLKQILGEANTPREPESLIADNALDISNLDEVEDCVGAFLKEPSPDLFEKLGSNPVEVINAHLVTIKNSPEFIQAYVDATLLMSGTEKGEPTARLMYQTLGCSTLLRQAHPVRWLFVDCMLRGLSLIKTENKKYKIRWPLPACYTLLASVIEESYFPRSARETLRYFIGSKLKTLPLDVQQVIEKHPSLLTTN